MREEFIQVPRIKNELNKWYVLFVKNFQRFLSEMSGVFRCAENMTLPGTAQSLIVYSPGPLVEFHLTRETLVGL